MRWGLLAADPRCLKWPRKVTNLTASDRAFPEQLSYGSWTLSSPQKNFSVVPPFILKIESSACNYGENCSSESFWQAWHQSVLKRKGRRQTTDLQSCFLLFLIQCRIVRCLDIAWMQVARERERTVEVGDWLTAKVKFGLLCQVRRKE